MNFEEEYLRKIVQLFNDPTDVTLQKDVEKLRTQSPEHETFFQEVHKLWVSSSELKELDVINVTEATERLSHKLKQTPRYIARYEENEVPLYKWVLRVAAVLVVGAIGFGLYFFRPTELLTKATTAGIQDSIRLSDGSKVSLDENTIVKYPEEFSGSERKIHLEKGNAFFSVAHDKQHPFVVQLGESSVTVLGTRFNITATKDELYVSVTAGSVRFESGGEDKSVLTAGNGVVYNRLTETLTAVDVTNKNADAWLTHELNFTDASLREVIQSLEQYYKVRVAVNDSIANFKKFNARFKNSELQEVLDVLEATYPIKIERKNSLIIIKSNP
jgi:ferric-dicitrate binding protein FerR (iron transport regulator)